MSASPLPSAEASRITVCLVEDDRGTRETIVDLLRGARDIALLESYGSGEEALTKVPLCRPDVMLVDINLPRMSGIECAAKLNAAMPELGMLMLTTHDEPDRIFDSLRAGASGYLLKNQAYGHLIEAIREVHAGGAPMTMQIARKVVRFFKQPAPVEAPLEGLTAREQEILALLATGKLYKEIGDQLGISLSTVRGHLHKVYAKLHVQSRTEAVLKYFGR